MFSNIFDNPYMRGVVVAVCFIFIAYGLRVNATKKVSRRSSQIGNVIYVDPSSEMGGLMTSMNKSEENEIIYNAKKEIKNNKITKIQAINSMNMFMNLWGNPPTRDFPTLKEYIKELEQPEKGKFD